MYCVNVLVSGLVQGVSYRWTTREQARQLGVTGHAINLEDGRVEVLLCGDQPAVEQMAQWLWQGPDAARVTSVEVMAVHLDCPPADFTVG
ncbi:acylphosphatase [Halomonas cupida]|uniref:acylphosphatase n=1 Tax=Halomonas cupida TaxID=44933 RepID=UPI003A927672